MQAFKYMYTNEGWKGFFKGNGVNIVKIAPFSAFEFFFYEFFKHTLFPNSLGNDAWSKLICGGLTGCLSQTLVRDISSIFFQLNDFIYITYLLANHHLNRHILSI